MGSLLSMCHSVFVFASKFNCRFLYHYLESKWEESCEIRDLAIERCYKIYSFIEWQCICWWRMKNAKEALLADGRGSVFADGASEK
jgi:hypothetical protein